MKTHVEFVSTLFPPYDGEDEEINPGRYGKRLAEFISNGLKKKGFVPQEPVGEDWGWVLPIQNDDFKLWIGCGNYPEYENGFLCFIEPHTETVKKYFLFGTVETTQRVSALQKAVDEILFSEPSISGVKWSTHVEFNRA